MNTVQKKTLWLGTAAMLLPFATMAFYLAATRGRNLHSAVEIDLFFLSIGIGIGCICLWALPFKSSTKIALVLPYVAVVGGGAFFFGFWFLARFFGMGP